MDAFIPISFADLPGSTLFASRVADGLLRQLAPHCFGLRRAAQQADLVLRCFTALFPCTD